MGPSDTSLCPGEILWLHSGTGRRWRQVAYTTAMLPPNGKVWHGHCGRLRGLPIQVLKWSATEAGAAAFVARACVSPREDVAMVTRHLRQANGLRIGREDQTCGATASVMAFAVGDGRGGVPGHCPRGPACRCLGVREGHGPRRSSFMGRVTP